jgi:hypothetical protein
MKRVRTLILAAAALFTISGCGQDPKKDKKEEESFTPIEVFGAPCPEDNVISWENFADTWIEQQCTNCHSAQLLEGQRADAPLGVDFGPDVEDGVGSDYAMVRFWANNMFLRAAYNHETMPPAGGPYPIDRIKFGDWMACQAPREQDMDQ